MNQVKFYQTGISLANSLTKNLEHLNALKLQLELTLETIDNNKNTTIAALRDLTGILYLGAPNDKFTVVGLLDKLDNQRNDNENIQNDLTILADLLINNEKINDDIHLEECDFVTEVENG